MSTVYSRLAVSAIVAAFIAGAYCGYYGARCSVRKRRAILDRYGFVELRPHSNVDRHVFHEALLLLWATTAPLLATFAVFVALLALFAVGGQR